MFDNTDKSNKFIDAVIRLAAKRKAPEVERKRHGKMSIVTKKTSTQSVQYGSLKD